MVPLDYIRLSKDQIDHNKGLVETKQTKEKGTPDSCLLKELVIPESLKVKATDDEKLKEQKKKKVKAIKQNHKAQVHTQAAAMKQSSWVSFQSKAI